MDTTTEHIKWTAQECANFGTTSQVSSHRYHELPMFEDDELIKLLDTYPRSHLQAHHMGVDPLCKADWKQVDIDDATTGAEILEAVKVGRIWLNLMHIEDCSNDYAELICGMYKHLGDNCPHLQSTKGFKSALILSSPGAQAYYQLATEPNMFWHIRGESQFWIYPAMNTHFVPQDFIEDIFSGEIDGLIPYKNEFDEQSEHFILKPGDAVSWHCNGPYRAVNTDMNISLVTSYTVSGFHKRHYVQLANRFILRNLGIKSRSMKEGGISAALKRLSYRAIDKIRPFTRLDRTPMYITDLQIDPNSPLGIRKLQEPKLASFVRKSLMTSDQ